MIAFHLPGAIPVYTFSLIIACASALGLAWVFYQSARPGSPLADRRPLRAGLWALAGALLGARLLYVFSRPLYFNAHPWQALQVNQGGLSAAGALLGGVLALLLYARLARQPAGLLADALMPLAASLAVGAWLGCWLDGAAYGAPASAWWALPARDEWGALQPRLPLQLFGALLSLGLFVLLDGRWYLGGRLQTAQPGLAASLGGLGLALILLGLSLLRADPLPVWASLRLDTWAALALAALSALLLLAFSFRQRRLAAPAGEAPPPS